jgi:hypothetical protein
MTQGGDQRDAHQRRQRLDEAYRSGDMAGVKAGLGWPEDFPNTPQATELALGDRPLDSAINRGPVRSICQLLDLGADVNASSAGGFPSLFNAIDARRGDHLAVVDLLLHYGARTDQRGVNDWTPLHHAVARGDVGAVKLLIEHGADAGARTRIDDFTSPLEDAQAKGLAEAVALMSGPLGSVVPHKAKVKPPFTG